MIWRSGPKKLRARDSAAIRCPSRQITASEIAGASLPAAMARARSPRTSPSAPSATCASVRAFPGFSNSAGDFLIILTPYSRCGNRAAGETERCRISGGAGSIPFTHAKNLLIGDIQPAFELVELDLAQRWQSARRRNGRGPGPFRGCRGASTGTGDGGGGRPAPRSTGSFRSPARLQRQKPGRGRAGFI